MIWDHAHQHMVSPILNLWTIHQIGLASSDLNSDQRKKDNYIWFFKKIRNWENPVVKIQDIEEEQRCLLDT